MAIKILIFNKKGGVGKTTTSVAIAGELSKNHGKRVLLFDLDSSANLSRGVARTKNPNPFEYFSDMLLEYYDDGIKSDIHDAICETDYPNIHICPAELSKMNRAERGLSRTPEFDAVRILHRFFDSIDDEYDYIVLDCAQGYTSVFTQMGLNFSDYLLSPTDDCRDSLDGFAWVYQKISMLNRDSNPNLKCIGIFMNRVKSNKELVRLMDQLYRTDYPDLYIPIQVRDGAAVGKASIVSEPLCYYDPSAKVTKDFAELTEFILKKIEGE